MMFSWQISETFNNKFFKEKEKHCYRKCGSDIYHKSSYATFYLTLPRFLISAHFIVTTGYIKLYQSKKKSLKVVNNTPTVGLWPSLTCQNSHAIISPLIFMTDFIDIYSLLPENVSFLECFQRSHSYFIRYYNNPAEITDNPTEITWNHFRGVFLKNHKYFQEMFLRRLRDVTEKT